MNAPFKRLICLLIFWTLYLSSSHCQLGCTDVQADNYDPSATMNDGSCTYSDPPYSLNFKTLITSTLEENSALEFVGNKLWTLEDGGNNNEIYNIDTSTNSILQTITIGGATNKDWESLATDQNFLYIGDFGNNAAGNRTDLKIYKINLSDIGNNANETISASNVEIIHFSYPEQTNFSNQGSNNTPFDCEAFFYADNLLHLFTKDWVNKWTVHYTLPTAPGTYSATVQDTLDTGGLITGAAVANTNEAILLGYDPSFPPTNFFWLLYDYQGTDYFGANKRKISLGSVGINGQTEGITFRNNAFGYISNEFTDLSPITTIDPGLDYFTTNQWVAASILPVELLYFEGMKSGEHILLQWATAFEENNAYFEIEKSKNAQDWMPLNRIESSGNSIVTKTYNIHDNNPFPGANYYRLKQVDHDGKFEYSKTIAIDMPTEEVVIFPNPSRDFVKIYFGKNTVASIEILNAQGQILSTFSSKNQNEISMDIQHLPPGIYFLNIQSSTTSRIRKINVIK